MYRLEATPEQDEARATRKQRRAGDLLPRTAAEYDEHEQEARRNGAEYDHPDVARRRRFNRDRRSAA